MATAIAIKDRKPKLPNPPSSRYETFLSRTETSDLLGCSPGQLVNYERAGRLTRHVALRANSRGFVRDIILYDPAEVRKLPRRTIHHGKDLGESAARAFELFKIGAPISDVVIEIRELPEKVIEWHAQWLRSGGAEIVVSGAARDALVALVGDFKTVPELVLRVQARLTALTAELAAARSSK